MQSLLILQQNNLLTKKPVTPRTLVLLLLCISFCRCTQKNEPQKTDKDVITISSKILNEDRKIYIRYTGGELIPGSPVPVLYLLDADNHFELVNNICSYLTRPDINVIPAMLIVGITNTNRTRDLTPTQSITDYFGKPDTSATSWLKTSGGNGKFLQFIREELMPYVDAHYKTAPFKIFAGHSFGGITTVNCLLTQPAMFNAYISVSPSFWWDNGYLLNVAASKLDSNTAGNKILFYSDGNEGVSDSSRFHTDLLHFDSLVKSKHIPGLEYKYTAYPDEIHMTEPVKAYYDAIRFIYSQWPMPTINDTLITGDLVMEHYRMLSKKYGYTIVPDENAISNWASWLVPGAGTLNNGISLLEMNTVNYPASATAFVTLGDAYAKKGERSKAAASYQKALALKPGAEDVEKKLKAVQ